jgi:hypothetical protein
MAPTPSAKAAVSVKKRAAVSVALMRRSRVHWKAPPAGAKGDLPLATTRLNPLARAAFARLIHRHPMRRSFHWQLTKKRVASQRLHLLGREDAKSVNLEP